MPIPTISLNDGRTIPQLGFGVWQIPNDRTAAIVRVAIDAGYRSIDTATLYHNEHGVGDGVRASAVARDAMFVTTKLWHDRHHDAERACDESLARLGLDYVDLYLIHWPAPRQNRYVDAWRALTRLRADGRARSIGVSNFTPAYLQRAIDATGIVPSINQVELHPHFQQATLRAFHAEHGIATEAWSPLGQGQVLHDATIAAIAHKHGCTPAQAILAWHMQLGIIAIPKSSHADRARENLGALDVSLDADDMDRIARLDRRDGRLGMDPEQFS